MSNSYLLLVVMSAWLIGAISYAVTGTEEDNVTDPLEAAKLIFNGLKWPIVIIGCGIIAIARLTHRHRFQSISPAMSMLMWGKVDTSPRCRCGARQPSPTLQPPGDPPTPPKK